MQMNTNYYMSMSPKELRERVMEILHMKSKVVPQSNMVAGGIMDKRRLSPFTAADVTNALAPMLQKLEKVIAQDGYTVFSDVRLLEEPVNEDVNEDQPAWQPPKHTFAIVPNGESHVVYVEFPSDMFFAIMANLLPGFGNGGFGTYQPGPRPTMGMGDPTGGYQQFGAQPDPRNYGMYPNPYPIQPEHQFMFLVRFLLIESNHEVRDMGFM